MSDAMAFTGERFTPECVREIWYEHWHRYAYAARHARGRRVLDAACGEGYGSALLARHAASVLGLDLSSQAVGHAQARYGGAANLRFQAMDATAVDALPDASFDLVVSFETLEHVEAQARMLDGFRRVLAPGGVLILSSPDKRTYSDVAGFRNEFHVRELYRDELEALLAPRFPAYRLLGQKLVFQSAIWDLAAKPARVDAITSDIDAAALTDGFDYAPLYFIAVCAADEADLPDLAGRASLFGDRDEGVYAHYNHEVRKNIAAGTLLQQMEAKLAAAEQRAVESERRTVELAAHVAAFERTPQAAESSAAAAASQPSTSFAARLGRWLGRRA